MLSLQSHVLPVKQNTRLPIPSAKVQRRLCHRRAIRLPAVLAASCPLCDRPSRRFLFVQTTRRIVVYNRCPHCRSKFHRRVCTPAQHLAQMAVPVLSAFGSALVVYLVTCLLLIGGQP